MNCYVEDYQNFKMPEVYKSSDKPTFAGNFRFLLGLVLAVAGLYIATLTNVQGHGLGFLMILGAPFVIFKDGK